MTENDRVQAAQEQMIKAGATEDEKVQVQQLLEIYWESDNKNVLEMFYNIAHSKMLTPEMDEEWRWLDAKPGNLFVRDTVRVRSDAYGSSDRKVHHNGRVGYVVAIRYGTVSVHYTDGNEAPADFVQHRLPLLEKRY